MNIITAVKDWFKRSNEGEFQSEARPITLEQGVLIGMLFLFNSLDYFMTIIGLRMKIAEEQNPIALAMLKSGAYSMFLWKFLLFGMVILVFVQVMQHSKKQHIYNLYRGILVVGNYVLFGVVVHNLIQFMVP